MEFTNDPTKCKKVFILMLVLTILFFVVSGVFGYLYYQKHKDHQNLLTEKQKLEDRLATAAEDLQDQAEELQKQIKELQDQKNACDDESASHKTKSATIKKYMDCLDYLVGLIHVHSGFDNWSEAEYQNGRKLVEATGDSNFLSVVDAAWTDEGGDQMTRLVNVFNALISGVNSNL